MLVWTRGPFRRSPQSTLAACGEIATTTSPAASSVRRRPVLIANGGRSTTAHGAMSHRRRAGAARPLLADGRPICRRMFHDTHTRLALATRGSVPDGSAIMPPALRLHHRPLRQPIPFTLYGLVTHLMGIDLHRYVSSIRGLLSFVYAQSGKVVHEVVFPPHAPLLCPGRLLFSTASPAEVVLRHTRGLLCRSSVYDSHAPALPLRLFCTARH